MSSNSKENTEDEDEEKLSSLVKKSKRSLWPLVYLHISLNFNNPSSASTNDFAGFYDYYFFMIILYYLSHSLMVFNAQQD